MRALLGQLKAHADTFRRHDVDTAPGAKNADPDPDRVSRILYREDRKTSESRAGSTLIHASALVYSPPCARRLFMEYHDRKMLGAQEEPVFGAMRLVWAIGRAVENHIRDTLLQDPDMKRDAYGKWECRCGHVKVEGHLIGTETTCPRCGRKPYRYKELTLFDYDAQMAGNPDFIFRDGAAYRAVEIKSIKGGKDGSSPAFDSRLELGALPPHIEQVAHYIRLMRKNGLQAHRAPLVIYGSKDFKTQNWYAICTPTDAQMDIAERAVAESVMEARRFARERDAEELPPMIEPCIARSDTYRTRCPKWAECMAQRTPA